MNKVLRFLRERLAYLVVGGCMLAALGAGIWTLRQVKNQLEITSSQGGTKWEQDANGVPEKPDPPVSSQPSEKENAVSSSSSVKSSAGVSSSGPSAGSSGNMAGSSGSAAALYALPVAGKVCKVYSGNDLIYSETLGNWRTHNGTDYRCAQGDTVIAPCSGTVTAVTQDGSWGWLVEITEADGKVWRVCGLAEQPRNAVGDVVRTGVSIGKVGTVPCESVEEPHIHLEVLRDGAYQNPAEQLAG